MKEKVAALVSKTEITAIGIRHADHVAPSIRKKERERERELTLTSQQAEIARPI
jgi:hypothetical protein